MTKALLDGVYATRHVPTTHTQSAINSGIFLSPILSERKAVRGADTSETRPYVASNVVVTSWVWDG